MIPKLIHFCWFSDEEYPDKIKYCIDSWHKYMPDYEIKKWDSSNFDFSINSYVQEAYEAKKWAFASDFVRLYALYHEGGIYLDSDIECLRRFDSLLDNKAFTGFERTGSVAAWIFGSEAQNPIFKEFLDYYKERHFVINGKMDLTPNPIPISRICKKHGMIDKNIKQELDYITIYSKEYFCGKDPDTAQICITPTTYTIHHFAGGWVDEKTRKEMEVMQFYVSKYNKVLPKKCAVVLSKFAYRIKLYGIYGCIKSLVRRLYEKINLRSSI